MLIKKLVFLLVTVCLSSFVAQAANNAEIAAWQQQARNVTIIRDDWGIPHIYGKTDADAVFRVVSEGGGMRRFGSAVRKLCVRLK